MDAANARRLLMVDDDVMSVQAHDIAALLEAVRDGFAALAAQCGLSLGFEARSRWVMTDADQLLRILGRLVDDAIEFTSHGSVRLLARRGPGSAVVASVGDTGPGVAEVERKRTFEAFYRVANPSRDRSQGLGPRRAIARRTARLLDIPLQAGIAATVLHKPVHGSRLALAPLAG